MYTLSFSRLSSKELAVAKEGHFTESAAHTTTMFQSTTVIVYVRVRACRRAFRGRFGVQGFVFRV
jgi:hypothetical protein